MFFVATPTPTPPHKGSELPQRLEHALGRERHGEERRGAERAERVVDRVHDAGRRAGGAGFAGALGAQLGVGMAASLYNTAIQAIGPDAEVIAQPMIRTVLACLALWCGPEPSATYGTRVMSAEAAVLETSCARTMTGSRRPRA